MKVFVWLLAVTATLGACKKTDGPAASVKDDEPEASAQPAADAPDENPCSSCHAKKENGETKELFRGFSQAAALTDGAGASPTKQQTWDELFRLAKTPDDKRYVCGRIAAIMWQVRLFNMPLSGKERFVAQQRVPMLNMLNRLASTTCAFDPSPTEPDLNPCLYCHNGKSPTDAKNQPLILGGLVTFEDWSWEMLKQESPDKFCDQARKIYVKIKDYDKHIQGYPKKDDKGASRGSFMWNLILKYNCPTDNL
jgi:hypothetical protein